VDSLIGGSVSALSAAFSLDQWLAGGTECADKRVEYYWDANPFAGGLFNDKTREYNPLLQMTRMYTEDRFRSM
jgi:hypothetical protein